MSTRGVGRRGRGKRGVHMKRPLTLLLVRRLLRVLAGCLGVHKLKAWRRSERGRREGGSESGWPQGSREGQGGGRPHASLPHTPSATALYRLATVPSHHRTVLHHTIPHAPHCMPPGAPPCTALYSPPMYCTARRPACPPGTGPLRAMAEGMRPPLSLASYPREKVGAGAPDPGAPPASNG